MKWMYIMLVFCSVLLPTLQSEAQVTIQLNNGKTIEGVSFSINKQDSSISFTSSKGKQKDYPFYQVFSVCDSLKNETVFYRKDSSSNIYTESQMRDFIRGEKDASLHFNPMLPYFAGAGVALGSSAVLGLSGISTTYSIFVPGTYCTVLALREMKESRYKPYASEPENPYFMEGFKRTAAEKRFRRNLIGAGIGFIIGFIIFR